MFFLVALILISVSNSIVWRASVWHVLVLEVLFHRVSRSERLVLAHSTAEWSLWEVEVVEVRDDFVTQVVV